MKKHEPKYIDADELKTQLTEAEWLNKADLFVAYGTVALMPAADVVEVVRCKDCKYQNKGQNECESWNICEYRPWLYVSVNDEDFCSNGDRNE